MTIDRTCHVENPRGGDQSRMAVGIVRTDPSVAQTQMGPALPTPAPLPMREGHCQSGSLSRRKAATAMTEGTSTPHARTTPTPRVATGVPRLDSRILILGPDDCWPWQGYIGSDGYGKMRYGGEGTPRTTAHRLVYEAIHGPIPDGMVVDHTCHNGSGCPGGRQACMHRRCVNPAHLEAVTSRENTLRGESPAAQHSRRINCANGHSLTEGVYAIGRGCATCAREKAREKGRRKTRRRTEARAVRRATWAAKVAADQAAAEARRASGQAS